MFLWLHITFLTSIAAGLGTAFGKSKIKVNIELGVELLVRQATTPNNCSIGRVRRRDDSLIRNYPVGKTSLMAAERKSLTPVKKSEEKINGWTLYCSYRRSEPRSHLLRMHGAGGHRYDIGVRCIHGFGLATAEARRRAVAELPGKKLPKTADRPKLGLATN
jgi:hypothetical protein